jgi:chromate reductase
MKTHAGFLIASPEYNSSITPLLKNTIDWASRPAEGEKPLECFRDKVITLISASPGQLGGLRGLVHVRSILGNIGSIVLPDQLAFGNAGAALNAEGRLSDPKQEDTLKNILRKQISIMTRLAQ